MNQHIQLIPIDRINILNPRDRNQKIFREITTNIMQVGLKRPITITPCKSGAPNKDYDLICGQGRIEAFMACGQKEIPAIVVDASQEQALIMSLVENLARRQHRPADLMQGIEILKKQGYSNRDIASKTGLSLENANGLIKLLNNGETRLLNAVVSGQIPISIATLITHADGDEQSALQEAYENKLLRGNRLLKAKQLIEMRRKYGKAARGVIKKDRSSSQPMSSKDIVKTYEQEIERQRLVTRQARKNNNILVFVAEAMRTLLKDKELCKLLKSEGFDNIPEKFSEHLKKHGVVK